MWKDNDSYINSIIITELTFDQKKDHKLKIENGLSQMRFLREARDFENNERSYPWERLK